jgi:hypothetical protein
MGIKVIDIHGVLSLKTKDNAPVTGNGGVPNPCNLDSTLSIVYPVDDPTWLTNDISDSGKSANLSTAWNKLLTNRSAAEVLSSAMKAAMSLRSNFAVGDQINLKAIH